MEDWPSLLKGVLSTWSLSAAVPEQCRWAGLRKGGPQLQNNERQGQGSFFRQRRSLI